MALRIFERLHGRARAVAPGLAATVLLAAPALTGCSSSDSASYVFEAPRLLESQTCEQLSNSIRSNQAALDETEQQMAKNAQSPGGSAVNVIAYDSTRLTTVATLRQYKQAYRERACVDTSSPNSDGAVR